MKDMDTVYGNKEQAVPLVISHDTVYVHTDIEQIDNGLFRYHETQYTKDEYIRMMAEENIALEERVTDLQMALCDVYEAMI